MNNRSEAAIEQKVDAVQYSDDELISIKTTLNLPYYTSSNEFERAYGSVNIGGKDYEYVKRRVHNDTLELLCLPNLAKTKLKTVGSDVAKASADGQSTSEKKSTTVLKLSLPDFFSQQEKEPSAFALSTKTPKRSFNTSFSFADYSLQQDRPPQQMQSLSAS
jgi:hypothetical protein